MPHCYLFVVVACDGIPTCIDQQGLEVMDNFEVGETLYKMVPSDPEYHFADFTSSETIRWTLEDSNLDVLQLGTYDGRYTCIYHATIFKTLLIILGRVWE